MDLIKAFWADLKSAFSKIQSLSPQVKKEKNIIYGCIGVLILVLFLIAHSKGTNDLTNWISAMANVVMAGAAVVGIWFAKNWKREATKDKVIGCCLDLLSKDVPEINSHFCSVIHVRMIKDWLSILNESEVVDFKKISFITKFAQFFDLSYEHNSKVLLSLREHLQEITYLSWEIKDDNFSELFKVSDSIVLKEFALLTYVKYFLALWNLADNDSEDNISRIGLTFTLKNNPKIIDALEICDSILSQKEELTSKFNNINHTQVSVFDIFQAKK